MYKKLLILIPSIILFFVGLNLLVTLASIGVWYSYTTPILALLLCYGFAKLWRYTFKTWYEWLDATSYKRNEAIKERIRASAKLLSTTSNLESVQKLAKMQANKVCPYGDSSVARVTIVIPKIDSDAKSV